MDLKPGYKQTEVGVIPEDWIVSKCSEITTLISKGASPRWQGFEYSDYGMLFVTSENVRDGFLDVSKPKYLPLEFHEKLKRTKLHVGDILINLVGASIGRSCRVTQNLGDANVNQAVAVFRLVEVQSGGYVAYVFQAPMTVRRIMDMQVDAARPNISLTNLREFFIALPPTKTEQEAIAEALSDADSLIKRLVQLIAKKRNLKQGTMQELLTGKQRLPGFSGEWETKAFSELFDFSGGFSASRDQLSSEGHCYLHYGDIHKSSKTFINVRTEYQEIPKLNIALKEVSPASLLDDGDVVFVDASEDDDGASKHVMIINKDKIPYIAGLHTIVAKSKSDSLDHNYRRYCFQTREVKQQFYYYAVGTKVTGISKTNIPKLVLPVPPRDEQAALRAGSE